MTLSHDTPIHPSRLLNRCQIFLSKGTETSFRELKRLLDTFDAKWFCELRMPLAKCFNGHGLGPFTNEIRDIDRVEVRMRDEPADRIAPDVVGINVVGLLPMQLPDGIVGRRTGTPGLGTDYQVLTIGFVPNRSNFHTGFSCKDAGAQLRSGLVRESVADTYRVFLQP